MSETFYTTRRQNRSQPSGGKRRKNLARLGRLAAGIAALTAVAWASPARVDGGYRGWAVYDSRGISIFAKPEPRVVRAGDIVMVTLRDKQGNYVRREARVEDSDAELTLKSRTGKVKGEIRLDVGGTKRVRELTGTFNQSRAREDVLRGEPLIWGTWTWRGGWGLVRPKKPPRFVGLVWSGTDVVIPGHESLRKDFILLYDESNVVMRGGEPWVRAATVKETWITIADIEKGKLGIPLAVLPRGFKLSAQMEARLNRGEPVIIVDSIEPRRGATRWPMPPPGGWPKVTEGRNGTTREEILDEDDTPEEVSKESLIRSNGAWVELSIILPPGQREIYLDIMPDTSFDVGDFIADLETYQMFLLSGKTIVETKIAVKASLRTPSVTIFNVRTKYEVEHDPATGITTVRVIEGSVELKPTNPALAPLTLSAGQQVSIGPKAMSPVSAPTPEPSGVQAGRAPAGTPSGMVSPRGDLTGVWQDNNGTLYHVRQVGSELFWRMDGRPRVMNVFYGTIAGNVISGEWADVPGGQLQNHGALSLRIESNRRMVKIGETIPYRGSVWTRTQ